MAKKILNIVQTAYRATVEEQDDPVLWVTAALRGAGQDNDVVLRGNAVNYAVKRQDASGLRFGDAEQTQPARLAQDVTRLIEKGVSVYLIEEDAAARGLEPSDLISGFQSISAGELPKLFENYDQIWHW